jgi:hypothetical protein
MYILGAALVQEVCTGKCRDTGRRGGTQANLIHFLEVTFGGQFWHSWGICRPNFHKYMCGLWIRTISCKVASDLQNQILWGIGLPPLCHNLPSLTSSLDLCSFYTSTHALQQEKECRPWWCGTRRWHNASDLVRLKYLSFLGCNTILQGVRTWCTHWDWRQWEFQVPWEK